MTDDTETRVREAFAGLAPSPEVRDDLLAGLHGDRAAAPGRGRRIAWYAVPAAAAILVGLLFGPALLDLVAPRPVAAPNAAAVAESVDAARAADLRAWRRIGDDLRERSPGRWAVIARGELAGLADGFEAASALAPDAAHRFVYRIGEDVDSEVFVSAWYAPRFAGLALPDALGWQVTFGGGHLVVEKDGQTAPEVGAPPFLATRLEVAAPGGKPRGLEVFLGTVGPPLMLAPPDWDELGLARFEVPGTTVVSGQRCRRARVFAGVAGIEGAATIIATCPEAPWPGVVGLSRWRDAFWNWSPVLSGPYVTEGRDGRFVLFGANRVLGEGSTPEEALRAGEGTTDFVYHRFLLKLPRGGPIEIPAPKVFTSPLGDPVILNGCRVPALHLEPDGPWVVAEESARRIRLELAEEGRDVILGGKETRGGYAWLGEGPPADRSLVFVVVAAP